MNGTFEIEIWPGLKFKARATSEDAVHEAAFAYLVSQLPHEQRPQAK